ncbi:MAG: hypothetical protein GY797_38740 [Deltaproteobacteria bacterium]|nr:hypothetical protein [Deltaproteobacteria bacterium]
MGDKFMDQLNKTSEREQLKSIEEFIEFLKKRKIYRQFKDALAKSPDDEERDFDIYMRSRVKLGLMSEPFQGFLWADTEEGFQFWNSHDSDWQNFYYKRGGQDA